MKRSNRSMHNALMHSFITSYLLLQLSCRRNSTSSKIHKTKQRLFRCGLWATGNGQRLFSVFLIRSTSRIQDSRVHDLCISRAYAHRARKNLHHFYHQHHRSSDLCRPVNASVLLYAIELYIRLQEGVAEVLAYTRQYG